MMKLKSLKEPYVILLIGPPLSGKTTYIKNNFPNDIVISRDKIILDVYGSDNYDEAFNSVNQKEVDSILQSQFIYANKNRENVIVDMTNMSSKRRRHTLSYFDKDYYKVGIIFPILTDEEYEKRNTQRSLDENKTIPMQVIKRMIFNYQVIIEKEGFNKIISL